MFRRRADSHGLWFQGSGWTNLGPGVRPRRGDHSRIPHRKDDSNYREAFSCLDSDSMRNSLVRCHSRTYWFSNSSRPEAALFSASLEHRRHATQSGSLHAAIIVDQPKRLDVEPKLHHATTHTNLCREACAQGVIRHWRRTHKYRDNIWRVQFRRRLHSGPEAHARKFCNTALIQLPRKPTLKVVGKSGGRRCLKG